MTYPDLNGKIVLLTGIGQTGDPKMWGNGAATAKVMCENGAKIFGCDLTLEAAQATQKRLQAEGGVVDVMAANVTKDADVKALVDACMKKYGRIDILINNVGRSEAGGPAEMSESTWDAQMDVNLKSAYLCCHHVLPIMERQRSGSVINIASISALRWIGKPQVGYSTSKAGLIGFTKVTAVLYAKKGVRMNVVVPGLMHTPLTGMLAQKYNNGDLEGMIRTRDAQVPTGKQGNGFDVAMASTFLCSNSARYITGQKLVVDGGITMSTPGPQPSRL